jgi:hypothetical protein
MWFGDAMTIIPFGEWTPDQPAINSNGVIEASGCYPRTAGSYGPLSTLSAVTSALSERCQGAFSARKSSNGIIYTFSGDVANLYYTTGTTWTEISDATYAIGSDEWWNFAQYGDRVIAVNIGVATKQYRLDTLPATVSALSASAPQARYVTTVREFVVVGNTYDGTDGSKPGRVWWSGFDNPTSWPTPGSVTAVAEQSDFNDMPSGGWVQGIIGAVGGVDALVFMESAIYRMSYEGPPTIFRFDEIERARGCSAPGSIVNTGKLAAYLAEDGFYVCDGIQSQPIGAGKVDKWFFSTADQTYLNRITGTADPINKLIIWSFCSGLTGNTPDKVILWNWDLNRWSYGDLACEMLLRAKTTGYTLEGLDAVSSSIDALPLSLDSRIWTGGRIALAGFDTSHRLAYMTGANQAATIITGEFDGQGKRLFVQGIRPVVDGGTVTASVGYRDTPSGSVTYTTAQAAGVNGISPTRVSARFARARVQIAAGGTWTHAVGVEPFLRPDGGR